MKKFELLEIEVLTFEEDIITTSAIFSDVSDDPKKDYLFDVSNWF